MTDLPTGRVLEQAAQLRPSLVALRGGLAASRRRGVTMGSRVAASKTKEAVYPMFLELAKASEPIDTFWQRFFNSMALGRFPKGVILREDTLVHRTRKKTSTYQLTAESRADWQEVAEFFRTVCDIRSERDWELRRDSGEVVVNLTTAQINKRIKKEHANAIPEFTLTLRTKYELSPAEMSEVDVLLRYYSTTNLFRPGDVILNDNGSIREITTLVFNRRTRQFTISAEADAPRCSMKETYQDIMTYLSGITASKTTERKMSFDDEFRKQQTQLYASQIAAREKAALALTEAAKVPKPRRKKVMSSAPIVAAIDEQVVTDDDVDIEPVEEPRRRHRSDDDSC